MTAVEPLRFSFLALPGGSTLEVAALSVAETFGLEHDGGPAVSLERALRHCYEGLRQYLTVRLNETRAAETLAGLAEAIEARQTLLATAGPRASLYAVARQAFVDPAPRLRPDDELWWAPSGGPAWYGKKLIDLRARLGLEAFEIAELAFARRLRTEEIALVVGRPVAELEKTLQDVQILGKKLFGESPPSIAGTLDGALLEAFALRGAVQGPRPRQALRATGDVVAGRYRIDDHLGTGAFADVYRATDLEVPDHVVALKLFRRLALDDAARQSALREVRLIASVSHPSVVQFKDYGWDAGRLYFVMPFYGGETLRARLARGALSRLEAKAIFVPLARALATMHATGVRHQDIKPENIFLARPHVDEDVLPVLIDLGVAVKDAENVLAGTPNYFAPEVAARFAREPDPPPVTGKADVFSLALVLRNALDPERDEGIVAGAVDAFVRTRSRKAPPPPRRRDLAYLASTFNRWLALAPDDRPTAEEMARQLSVLSRPEERRARTTATLRWAVPIVVTFAGLFGAAAFALTREAELQRSEATRALQIAKDESNRAKEASERADHVGADLAKAEAKGRSLEADVARLEEEYRTSTMTRRDLAERLAQTEGELGQLKKEREEEIAQAAVALKEMRAERDILKTFDEASRAGLAGEKRHSAELADHAAKLEAELDKARHSTEEARARAGELEDRIAALRNSLGPVTKPAGTPPAGTSPAGASTPPTPPPPGPNQ